MHPSGQTFRAIDRNEFVVNILGPGTTYTGDIVPKGCLIEIDHDPYFGIELLQTGELSGHGVEFGIEAGQLNFLFLVFLEHV
jgi:hypothetical protein